jgi:hypothetical protein
MDSILDEHEKMVRFGKKVNKDQLFDILQLKYNNNWVSDYKKIKISNLKLWGKL